MAREWQTNGDLSEAFVTTVLGARRVGDARDDVGERGEDAPESYVVAIGDAEHPVWMRVWPDGGGVALESTWGRLHIEGITKVVARRGHLVLESSREREHLVVELAPTGTWLARRAVVPPAAADGYASGAADAR